MIRPALTTLAVVAATALPTHAQEQCRLALLLAMDVSASVDEAEYALQINGLVSALLSPEVQNGFFNGPGPVALGIYEWSGRFQQDILVDWTLIETQEDLVGVTEQIAAATRSHADFPTALGYAIGYAAERFAEAPPCLFQTLDISGDGQNNDGFPPAAAYEHFPLDNITVNGLAIGGASREIELYYEQEVIRGPGAFVEHAINHEHFEEVMRRKLERELRVMILGELEP
ncbi:DUF1194 domain-containing protein [Rhodophyticola porphyridii]|uniref:DUF1194 domain-containing protein n=1 Tax=Rhodophyticola porphyridii TaxID=1852017 RepID=UPI0035CF0B17